MKCFTAWKNPRWRPCRGALRCEPVVAGYHIAFYGNFYSVPNTLVQQVVEVRSTPTTVEIFHQAGTGREASVRTLPSCSNES